MLSRSSQSSAPRHGSILSWTPVLSIDEISLSITATRSTFDPTIWMPSPQTLSINTPEISMVPSAGKPEKPLGPIRMPPPAEVGPLGQTRSRIQKFWPPISVKSRPSC